MNSIEYTNRIAGGVRKDILTKLGETNQTVGELELRTHIGKQLSTSLFKITGNVATGQYMTIEKVSGDIKVSSSNDGFILEPYRTYLLQSEVGIANGNVIYDIFKNKTDDNEIGIQGDIEAYTKYESNNAIAIITPTKQIEVGLYVENNLEDSLFRNGSIIVQEINRQVILDPVEEAKNLEFDIGQFIIDAQSSNLSIGSHIEFEKVYGNIECSTGTGQENGIITLKANKKYRVFVRFSIDSNNATSHLYTIIYNKTKDKNECNVNASTGGCTNYSFSGINEAIIETGNTDEEIELQITYITNPQYLAYATMIVQEIPHPYYFNYFKDSLSSTILFEGTANITGEYELSDNISKYKWLIVYSGYYIGQPTEGGKHSTIVDISSLKGYTNELLALVDMSSNYQNNTIKFHFEENKLVIDQSVNNNNYIYKIEGIGFNYDNPHRDIQKEIDVDNLSEETLRALKNKLNSITIEEE